MLSSSIHIHVHLCIPTCFVATCQSAVFRLFCFGLGSHVLVCLFHVLVSLPFVPIGLITSIIIISAASRIWSVGEDIIDKLYPLNVTSALLKGDPASINRPVKEYPRFYRLNQSEYELIARPEGFPTSGILKLLETESTDSGEDENNKDFGVSKKQQWSYPNGRTKMLQTRQVSYIERASQNLPLHDDDNEPSGSQRKADFISLEDPEENFPSDPELPDPVRPSAFSRQQYHY